MTYAVLGVMMVSALWPGGRGAEASPYDELNHIGLEQPTEHVAWGVPLDGGAVKVLFIAPRFTLRDAAELAQRLEIEFDSVALWDAHRLGPDETAVPGASAQETQARLMDRLADKWDVIVAGNFELGALPEEALKALRSKVEGGTGLVLANFREGTMPPAAQEFLDAIEPVEAPGIGRGTGSNATPEWKSGLDFLSPGTCGKGRVALLDYPGAPPYSHFMLPSLAHPWEAESEYADAYYSLVAKAVLWAAHREREVWIDGVEAGGPTGPKDEEIPPIFPEEYVELMKTGAPRLPYLPYRIRLNKPADDLYGVRVQVRQAGRHRTAIHDTYGASVPLRKGQRLYGVVLPLGTGTHLLDVWLLKRDRVVDWHTAVLEVEGWPSISGLAFSKDSLLPNDTLGVTLTIPPALHEEYVQNSACTVLVRAVDPLERIVAAAIRAIPPDVSRVTIDLGLADVMTHRVKVEVFALDMGKAVASETREPSEPELSRAAYAYRYFPVRQLPDDFAFVVSGRGSTEYNVRHFQTTLSALGVDGLYTVEGGLGSFFAGESNLRAIPSLTSYANPGVEDAMQRLPCLANPEFLRGEASKLEEAVGAPWVRDAAIYSLGDGNCLSTGDQNLCQCSQCLTGFRSRLEADYGTAERLRAAWGTYAADWTELWPITRDAATASGVYPPWVDFRQYMDTVFTAAHTLARDVLQLQSPKARVGFGAAEPGLYSGYAWSQLSTEMSFLGVPLDRAAVEKVRSYRGADSTALLLSGGGPEAFDETRMGWYPWYAAFHGLSGVWHRPALAGADVEAPETALTPDGRPLIPFHAMADSVAQLEQGLAAILRRTEPVKAPIAIYDSAASRYLNAVEDSFGTSSARAETSWLRMLRETGYAFDFVAADQAPERLKRYKLLVLPMARALSDGEVEAIRAFHAGGGHVIADVAPGAFDEHGAPRETPALSELFGVRWTGKSQAAEPAEASVGLGEGSPTTLPAVVADGAVEANDAEAKGHAGEAPVWFVKRDGEALAVLLNHAPLDYPGGDGAGGLRSLVGRLFGDAGIERAVPVKSKSGAFSGETAAFRCGKSTLYALLRDPDRGGVEKVEFEADSKGYSFDLRQGLPLRNRASLRLDRGEAALVARLPYDVFELELITPESVTPGRRVPVSVALKTRGGLPDEHVVRVEFGPTPGAPLRHYGRNVICTDGKGSTYIPLALHERPGMYRVVAWDVLTGVAAEAMVQVEAPETE